MQISLPSRSFRRCDSTFYCKSKYKSSSW
ncbi:LCI fold-containing protein [Peptoniphilus lacrimalis]